VLSAVVTTIASRNTMSDAADASASTQVFAVLSFDSLI
jgi:hypothetical protein